MRWWFLSDSEDSELAARLAADHAGATLRNDVPVYGWARRLKRDGKLYPCRDGARGAVRMWIWYGDI